MKEGEKSGVRRVGGLRREKEAQNIILVGRKMNFLGKYNRIIGQYLESI